MALDVAYAAELIEAAVLEALRVAPGAAEFRRRRDALYEIADAEARERAFGELHARWFERLRLGQPLEVALGESPAIPRACDRALVARATSGDETADLLVTPSARATVVIQVRAETLACAERALLLLRRQLMHVADMLDPAFGYSPRLDTGTPRASIIRARYRVLWDLTIDSRLVRRGHVPPDARADRRREFCRAFGELDDAVDAVFTRAWDADGLTHAEILALAVGTRRPECPLCGLPSCDLLASRTLAPATVHALRGDFPAWTEDAGVCRRCAELYQARSA
jgi:hypothetical protein